MFQKTKSVGAPRKKEAGGREGGEGFVSVGEAPVKKEEKARESDDESAQEEGRSKKERERWARVRNPTHKPRFDAKLNRNVDGERTPKVP